MARRMVSGKTIKNKNGEVIINDAMTVSEEGDVVVGRNLEVDGTLTIGGSPVGGLYKHDCSVSIGPDNGYFSGQITIINNSPEELELDNETARKAISAFGAIYDGPSGQVVEDGIIGIVVRTVNRNDRVCLVARPYGQEQIYYDPFDFDDHTNYSLVDIITAL